MIAISAVVESSTSITVKWERYTFATVNSYKICADSQTERNCVQNINSSLTELLIGNLTSNTRYEISVFAFTNLGVTPMSNVLIATTTGLLKTIINMYFIKLSLAIITNYELYRNARHSAPSECHLIHLIFNYTHLASRCRQ